MTKQFTPVSDRYGSPMGRTSYGELTDVKPRSLELFRVRLNDGYDDGGAYWGSPNNIYCARDRNGEHRRFVRAGSRDEARRELSLGNDQLLQPTSPAEKRLLGDLIRRVIFRPYGSKTRPYFTLCVYSLPGLAYSLRMGYSLSQGSKRIFSGNDFSRSSCCPEDSDAVIRALMSFLCLRVGDVEDEYFNDYTATQVDFRDTHAESLYMEVVSRFGEE